MFIIYDKEYDLGEGSKNLYFFGLFEIIVYFILIKIL
jgi:hypothetical protein